jgi:AraC-like DNA-binding protein
MHCSASKHLGASAPVIRATSGVPSSIEIVADELSWRSRPHTPVRTGAEPRIAASRWQALEARPAEFAAETAADGHVLKIVLRTINLRLTVDGRTVQDGVATPGMFHVTGPGMPVRCLFRGPFDTLHLHIPCSVLAACAREMNAGRAATLSAAAPLTRDAVMERLGRALIGADQIGGALGRLYADSIGLAIVARLLAVAGAAAAEPAKVAELSRWRLKRALEYVEAHLAEPVALADLAAAAGLTRMHFAAQFRAATGLRPHEYLLRRRVERAQELLVRSGMPLVEVALSVGFQTQSHFTTVFKGFVGQPPHAWRQSQGASAPLREEPRSPWPDRHRSCA